MTARIRSIAAEIFMWLLAGLGLVCIVFVALAYFMNLSLMMFRTGSMEPTIPAGSVAVVQDISAEDVAVGDILTVDRSEDQLPVTHRVTSTEATGTPGERIIRTQGDANTSEDRDPYTITEARKVLFHVPGIAHFVNQLNNPWVLGSATLGASALVTWAFWPRGPRRERKGGNSRSSSPQPPRRAKREGGPAGTQTKHFPEDLPGYPWKEPADVKRHSTEPKAPRSLTRTMGLLAGVTGAGTVLTLSGASPAEAQNEALDLSTQVTEGDYLSLTSVSSPSLMTNLSPGDQVLWDLGLAAQAPADEPGVMETGIRSTGEVPLNLRLGVCTQPWEDDPIGGSLSETSCPGSFTMLAEAFPLPDDGEVDWLAEFATEDEPWLRLEVSVPTSLSNDLQNSSALVEVHLVAEGDYISTPPPGEEPPEEPPASEEPSPSSAPTPPPTDGETPPHDSDPEAPADPQTPVEANDPNDDDLALTGTSALWFALLAAGGIGVGGLIARASRHGGAAAH